jgi:prepilin-type N-terminal cleavage/methylation domain-containing protein
MARGVSFRLRGGPGFTLVELLIIMAILGVLFLAGQPMFSTLTDASLSSAAKEVRTALEFAQLVSMTTGMPCRVTIDAALDTLAVEQLGNDIDFTDNTMVEILRTAVESESYRLIGHPLKPGTSYRIDFRSETRFHGVAVTGAIFGAGNWVAFDRLGVPSDGGTVTLEKHQRQIVVTVAELTGRVTVSG